MKFNNGDAAIVHECIILMEEEYFLRQMRKFFFHSMTETESDILLSTNRFAVCKIFDVNYVSYIPKHCTDGCVSR